MCYMYVDIFYLVTCRPVGPGVLFFCLLDYIHVCNDVCTSVDNNNKKNFTYLLTYLPLCVLPFVH